MDLAKAKKEFIKYTEEFNLKNENMKLKQLHSLRVMNISKEIAERLNLDKEEVDIATLIGLLHDIARFEQYKRAENFNDLNSFDHGDYGVEILTKDIRKYIETDKYDTIIKKAIKNHNKFQIEEGLTEKEEKFAKIIRDADKIDILYESAEIFWRNKEEIVNKSKISEYIYDQFNECKLIKKEKNTKYGEIDGVMLTLAYTFDINYKECFEIIKNNNYINDTIDRFELEDEETNIKVKEMIQILNNYVEEQIKRGIKNVNRYIKS